MRLTDLQPASFRGARFLVPRDMTEEGRNTILHEYPDAAHRFAEDNGYIPPKFELTCVLHGQGLPGKVKTLRRALNTPGPGTLQHPHYGAQFCAVVGPYRVIREDTDSGVVIIEATFAVTGPPLFPGVVSGIAAVVTGLAGSAVTQLFAAFAARFSPPRSESSRSVLAAGVTRIAATAAGRFGATAAATRIARDAGALVAQPETLASQLGSLNRGPFDDLALANPVLVRGFAALIDTANGIGLDAAAIGPATLDLTLRQDSLSDIADANRGAAFAGLAEAMAGRAHVTSEDVAADETLLETAFESVQASSLPGEDHRRLAQVYVAASEVLRDREVRLPRLAEIGVVEFPASVLSYQIYDTDAQTQVLASINSRLNPILYDGQVSVLVQPD